jgi:hypothetical protein
MSSIATRTRWICGRLDIMMTDDLVLSDALSFTNSENFQGDGRPDSRVIAEPVARHGVMSTVSVAHDTVTALAL